MPIVQKKANFFIGKSENPDCFNGKISSELNICYSSSPRAWMNFSLFSTWLKEFDIHVSKTSGRRVALLLENASAHGKSEDLPDLLNVEVIYLQKILLYFYNL